MKASHELVVGDKLHVGGIKCTIIKVDEVFHYTPKAFIRLELEYDEMTSRRDRVCVFLPLGFRVKVVK